MRSGKAMTLIADSGAVYALYDLDDAHHLAVRQVFETEPGAIILPVVLLAELDYLLEEYLGVDAELDFLKDLASGAFTLEPFSPQDLQRCQELLSTYRDLKPGLVDVAVVAAAEKLGINRILTLDERDFRVLRPKGSKPFTLLPADEES